MKEQSDQYIDALDAAFLNELVTPARGEGSRRSRWFSGQQISVGIDGKFRANWQGRTRNQDKFIDQDF